MEVLSRNGQAVRDAEHGRRKILSLSSATEPADSLLRACILHNGRYVRVREPDNTHGQTWMDRDRPAVRDSDLGRRDWTALFQGKRRFDRRGYATLALQP